MSARLAFMGLLAAEACAGAPLKTGTVAELEDALRGAGPGDTVCLADGVYRTVRPIRAEGLRGTAEAPVVIRAEHRGKAEIGGAAGFVVRNCEHVVLEGFVLMHDADEPSVLLDGCRSVRVSRNVFRLHERAKPRHMEHWVYAVGAHSASNRVDHNRFEHKVNSGSPVFVRGDDAALACSRNDRIDHNHIRDIVFVAGKNGHEAIRTGGNDLGASGQSSFATIESNLLERCSGDEEVISLKSSDNVVRNNTLLNCRGAICLRLGNRNEVSGNFVLATGDTPDCGGVKLYGFDHRIFNNYFFGLSGVRHEAPLALIPGTLDTPETDRIGKRYNSLTTVPATRAWIAFNTWIDCAPLQFGFKRDKERTHIPDACAFVNNLVVRTRPQKAPLVSAELVKDLKTQGNLGYDCGAAPGAAWAGWLRSEEPRLRRSDDGSVPWRLTESSPAVDAAADVAQAPGEDVFGRPRAGRLDAGAEEFGQETVRLRPLTPADVGPDAP